MFQLKYLLTTTRHRIWTLVTPQQMASNKVSVAGLPEYREEDRHGPSRHVPVVHRLRAALIDPTPTSLDEEGKGDMHLIL